MAKTFLNHIKVYVFRGLFAVIPLGLCFFVVRFLYVFIDKKITGRIDDNIGFHIPGLGILIVLVVLYLVGVSVSNLIGKQVFGLIERFSRRIPLIGSIYKIGKQLTETLSLPEKQIFKRVILVEYLRAGSWTIGFVTGSLIEGAQPGEKYLKVFVPTPPNPATGTLLIVRESQVRDPGWTIEEALKTVMSAGIIGPSVMK